MPTLEQFKAAFFAMTQADLKEMLERRHPDYETKKDHWDFLEATYEGGRSWFPDNIFKYVKEGDTDYAARLLRAYRFNHTREIVDLVNKYVFKADIHRKKDDAPDAVKRFWKQATLRRRDINEFQKMVASKSSVFGKLWVVVDTNKRTTDTTVAEDKAAGVRTYAYFVRPQDALDMAFSKDGDLQWILIREANRDDATPMSSGSIQTQFRIWTDEHWALFDSKKDSQGNVVYEFIGAGEHGLGKVPVFSCDHVTDEALYSSQALIDDTAYLDRSVANYLSNLDAIIQDQTFSQLVIPAQAMLPGESEHEKLLEMGTKSIFTYDSQANMPPTYISPDADQAKLILEVVQKIIGEIYHSTGMSGERTKQDNSMGIDNSSGVAKAYDFERMNAMLASKAAALNAAEIQLIELVLAYNSEAMKEEYEELVIYPKNFDVRGLADEFSVAQSLALMAAPKLVRRAQMKALADKLFPTMKKSEREKIDKEIDNDWLSEEELLALAGLPPAGAKAPPKPAGAKRQGQVTKDTK